MPTSANTVIGYVVDVQGDLLVATLVEDDQGHAPTVTIGDEDVMVGQLGSYVAVKQNEVYLIAIITRMTEQEALAAPTIETPGDDTARLPFAKRIARLTPVGSIVEEGQFERGVTQYPTTGAEVHAIGSADIARMFDRFQSKGLAVGTLASHPSAHSLSRSHELVWPTLRHLRADRIRKVVDGRRDRTKDGRRHAQGPHHHLRSARRVLLEVRERKPTLRVFRVDRPPFRRPRSRDPLLAHDLRRAVRLADRPDRTGGPQPDSVLSRLAKATPRERKNTARTRTCNGRYTSLFLS